MFKSEPICILKAGPTIDGRHTDQQVIDDIADTYNPKLYTARINEEHWQWGAKLGSVLSVEKRDDELWAVIKPNSRLLSNVERDQLLHTSCEYERDFAKTGKAYLSGLAMTDSPASLGTTQVHLSAGADKRKGQESVSSGATVSMSLLSGEKDTEQEEHTLLSKLVELITGNKTTLLSKQCDENEEDAEVSKKLEELLEKSTEQNAAIVTTLSSLAGAIEKLSTSGTVPPEGGDEDPAKTGTPPDGNAELLTKFEELSTKVTDLTTKLSSLSDEEQRKLAGEGANTPWL